MLGCLDYVNWKWKNCPTAWAGQYSRCQGKPTIILEAVTSYDLWTWPAYFGLPGSNNDINAIQSSILFDKLARVITPANYNILGKVYDDDYYLAGGTCPKWSTLVQTISWPQGLKKQYFAAMQEGFQKDVKESIWSPSSTFCHHVGTSIFLGWVLHDCLCNTTQYDCRGWTRGRIMWYWFYSTFKCWRDGGWWWQKIQTIPRLT